MNATEPSIVNLQAQPLSREAFAPYGEMLGEHGLSFPEFDMEEGRLALETFSMPATPMHSDIMGFHFDYTQPIIVLDGTLTLLVAPPPGNPDVALEAGDFDAECAAAFEIPAGQAIMLKRGAWHTLLAEESCRVLHLVRRLTEERFSSPAEFVNLSVRDGLRLVVTH
jgi:ureidoglycolate hydrolase